MKEMTGPVSGSLDANVILRLILRDVPKLSDAAFDLISKGHYFHIADIAVIETVFALERYYDIPRLEITEIIQSLANNPKINLNLAIFEESLAVYSKFPKLSIEDCCLAGYAKLNNALPLWTFDEKLSKQLNRTTKLIKSN
jgi:predicted nucleic-acid-binding protein